MASIKLVLRKNKKKSDGTIPIAVRVTVNRKARFMFTGQYILEKEWDAGNQRVKKSHPNSKRLNNMLIRKLAEANDVLLELEVASEKGTAEQVKQKVTGKKEGAFFFKNACDRVLKKYESRTFSVAKAELSIIHNVETFLRFRSKSYSKAVRDAIAKERKVRIGESRKPGYDFVAKVKHMVNAHGLTFREIDTKFLNDYKHFCKTCLGQKDRTITNQLIFIRTLFNQAVKLGIVDAKYYPFGNGKEVIRLGEGGTKIGLSREELSRIEAFQPEPNTQLFHARNAWLFSFYFAGIRISDVLSMQWDNFDDGRLYYVMGKNQKPVSLKVPEKAQAIMEHYRTPRTRSEDYIFPYMNGVNANDAEEVFVKSRNGARLINDYLKILAEQCDIHKPLSNHIARHTFGNLAGDSIHPLMLQKLYRHFDLKTTINYQANFIHRDADDALDSVIEG